MESTKEEKKQPEKMLEIIALETISDLKSGETYQDCEDFELEESRAQILIDKGSAILYEDVLIVEAGKPIDEELETPDYNKLNPKGKNLPTELIIFDDEEGEK